jgi:hypothetical protein
MNGLFAVDEWLLTVLLALLLAALVEVGFQVGRRTNRRDDRAVGQVNTLQGASLGLLALLLGFTFALAAGKFEQRRTLLVEEANAIGTLRLRGDLLPADMRAVFIHHVDAYIAAKVEAFEAGISAEKYSAANATAVEYQKELWAFVSIYAAQNQTPIAALVVQALNDVIDMHTTRAATVSYRLPDAVFLLLTLIAAFAFALIGYGGGLTGERHPLPSTIMVILVSGAILLIIDLDRPQRGFFHVDATPLMALRTGP